MTMRRTMLFLLSACALAAPLQAQTFSADRIRSDVAYLADDKTEGRGTGTPGFDLAARYVADRFETLRLQPGTASGWYQQIPFVTAAADPPTPSSISFGGKTYRNGDHAVVGPSMLGERIVGDADMVFVGYGLEDKAYGLDDYR